MRLLRNHLRAYDRVLYIVAPPYFRGIPPRAESNLKSTTTGIDWIQFVVNGLACDNRHKT